LREGPHHHLAKKNSLDWLKRRATDFTKIFTNNLYSNLDSIKKGKPFKAYDIIGNTVTHTQIQSIEFPWHILDVMKSLLRMLTFNG
jgi:hypothetical protein